MNTYKRHRFPPDIISYAVWLCYRFNLSHRDIEDLLAERGITVSREAIRLWCIKFGAPYTRRLKLKHQGYSDTFFIDEVFVKIKGKQHYLWRAVDQDGEVVDVYLQVRRDGAAAIRFFKRLLKSHGEEPRKIVTDKLRSCGDAYRELILFEGRDTAGKGGGIMRFARFLNPRHYRIVALNKPTEVERGQWFLQRYIEQLPDPGEIVFFDRSWYNRAVVEPVMGFCSMEKHEEFMAFIVTLEEALVNDGIRIIKFWFSIERDEQKDRLAKRKTEPLHMWKMSTVDAVAQQNWEAYS